MKAGRTLSELAAEIERQAKVKRDFIADTRLLQMRDYDGPEGGHELRLGLKSEEFHMKPMFHQQLGSKVGIHKKYYDRMLAEAPGLLCTNVNHWLQEEPEERMVRTLDGSARAFLSDRFRPLDHYDLAQAVFPALSARQCKVESCEITDSRLYIQAVAWDVRSNITRMASDHTRVNDPVAAGLIISNSEVGCGSLSVKPMIYRLVCKNGLIVADYGMRQTHVGRSQGTEGLDARELFTEETLQADDAAFFLKVRDTVNGVLTEEVFGKIVADCQLTTERRLEGDVPKAVEMVQAHIGLNETETGNVLRHLIEGGDLSQWGVVNAVTRAAADVESYDRAVELEGDAWKLVELGDTEWEQIARAA